LLIEDFWFNESIHITLQDNITSDDLNKKIPHQLYLFDAYIFLLTTRIFFQFYEVGSSGDTCQKTIKSIQSCIKNLETSKFSKPFLLPQCKNSL
jgi:hypothetical protein